MIFTLSGLPRAFQQKRAVLNADSFASAPPDVRKTACMVWSVISRRRSANVIDGIFDEPTKPEK